MILFFVERAQIFGRASMVLTVLFLTSLLTQPSYSSATLDLPLLDFPDSKGPAWKLPSMQQSLKLSTSFYHGTHRTIEVLWAHDPWLQHLGILGWDLLALYLPLGSGWMHEEWHRSVLSLHNADGYNEFYDLPFGKETVSVKKLRDEDLIRIKSESPSDMVRLSSAGLESQIEQNLALEKSQWLAKSDVWINPVLWFNQINASLYLFTCGSNDANRITDQANQDDGSDILKRDFTGLDCTAWVYDLHRPDEPYSARGVHPSGVGINRYRKLSDLNEFERDELRKQTWLSLFNYLDPQLYGISSFDLGDSDLKWMTRMRHHLTSFGSQISLLFLLKNSSLNLLASVSANSNSRRVGPELEGVFRPTNPWLGFIHQVRGSIWYQPERQRFDSDTFKPGALLGARTECPMGDQSQIYFESYFKSEGWVAGEPNLEPTFRVAAGWELKTF